MNTNEIAFQLIMHSGNARSNIMEALKHARNNEFKKVEELMAKSDEELIVAHKIQTNLVQSEARRERNEVSIILVHAQDHLMTALLARDLANEIIDLRKTNRR